MDELENTVVELSICGCENPDMVSLVQESVSSLNGVEETAFASGILRVVYFPMCISLSSIEERIESLGFRILRPEPPKRKGPVGRFLDRLAASNERAFGSKPLDCCTVGREKKSS